MRINNGVMVDHVMRNLQDNMEKLDELNQQLSSGKKFNLPSENPTGTATSMELESVIEGHEQYLRNIGKARDWMQSTDSALDNAGEVLQRAREQAVYGANETLTKADRQQLAKEIGELKEQLVSLGNSKLGDRYLFAGQKTTMEGQKPFAEDGSYHGNTRALTREIGPGINMQINVDGKESFQQAIEDLGQLEKDLKNNNTGGIEKAIPKIDEAINTNVQKRAEIGAQLNRLDLNQNKLEDEKIQSEELLSENEDVDIAKTITNLKMQESVYRASLASGARVMQNSLVDFLR